MDFRLEDINPEEVARRIAAIEPLTDSVRELIDAVIRTEVDDATIDEARTRIDEVVAALRVAQKPGPYGIPFTRELVGMPWGNAAVGVRNAIAPPLRIVETDGVMTADVTLGAAYEGPAGHVHGGVIALLIDQVVGECASNTTEVPFFTGTLTVRYLRPTALGPLSLRAEVTERRDRKAYVRAQVCDADGPTAECEAVMIRPRWMPDPQEFIAALAPVDDTATADRR